MKWQQILIFFCHHAYYLCEMNLKSLVIYMWVFKLALFLKWYMYWFLLSVKLISQSTFLFALILYFHNITNYNLINIDNVAIEKLTLWKFFHFDERKEDSFLFTLSCFINKWPGTVWARIQRDSFPLYIPREKWATTKQNVTTPPEPPGRERMRGSNGQI